MISEKFIATVKLHPMKMFRIAQTAGICQSTLSQIVSGVRPVKKGDPRVLAIAKVVGLKPEECFTQDTHVDK